jgi:hypothetical protein
MYFSSLSRYDKRAAEENENDFDFTCDNALRLGRLDRRPSMRAGSGCCG